MHQKKTQSPLWKQQISWQWKLMNFQNFGSKQNNILGIIQQSFTDCRCFKLFFHNCPIRPISNFADLTMWYLECLENYSLYSRPRLSLFSSDKLFLIFRDFFFSLDIVYAAEHLRITKVDRLKRLFLGAVSWKTRNMI